MISNYIITKVSGATLSLYDKTKPCTVTAAKQSVELLSTDTLDLSVKSAVPLTFDIGDKITVIGRTYTMNSPATEKKAADNLFLYDLHFEGVQYDMLRASYSVNVDTSNGKVQDLSGDSLTGDIKMFLDVLIANLNRVFGAGKWVLGTYPSGTATLTETFTDSDNCLSVLQSLCGEDKYNTEFTITENAGVKTLNIGVSGKTHTFTYQYGKGNGLYELTRQKLSSSNIITRLNVYGGTKNIATRTYRAARLCLPTKNKATSYLENATAKTKYGTWEATKIFDNIYPHRTGTVSALGATELKIIDTSMDFDLNAKDGSGNTLYLIPGTTAKIHFNTGNLAGYEFEISEYNATTKQFTLLPFTDENGYTFPSPTTAAFKVAIGDKYVIVDIYMPASYITAAETELQTAGQAFLDKYSQPKVSYGLTIDPFYLKNIVGESAESNIIWAGDYIPILDTDLSVNKSIRVKGFTRDLLKDYSYSLTIADLPVSVSTISRVITELNGIDKIVRINNLQDPAKARRSYLSAQEVLNMVFDTEGDFYASKIKPLSIDTTMLSVGAKSMQFGLAGTIFQPNYAGTKNRVVYTGGTLTHYAIVDVSGNPVTWNITDGDVTLTTDVAHYIYAKCSRSTAGATMLFSTTKILVESDASYYHFLVGVLNSVGTNNERALALMYGFTTINGRFIKTGRVQSADGNTYFDLDAGEIRGTLKFTSGTNVETAVNSASTAATNAQTAATNAQTDATNALNQLTNITSDNVLSSTEKGEQRQQWNVALAEKSGLDTQATNFSITTEKTAYDNAFQALANYLNAGVTWSTGTPTWLSDANLGTNTTIVGATYRTTWETLFSARQTLLNAISTKAKTLADGAQTTANTATTNAATAQTAANNAQTDATNALGQLTNITSDNVLSIAEKSDQRREWNIISAEKAGINTQATTFAITTENTTYNNAFQALATYLNAGTTWSTGIPSWLSDANLSSNTTIVGSTYRTTWETFYTARTALLNAIAGKAKTLADAAQTTANTAQTTASNAATAASAAQTDATNALGQLSNITSDNVLSPVEKSDQRQEWNVISSEKSGLDTQATTFGITTEKTTYGNAFQALATYLNAGTTWSSGIPSWLADANIGSNTTIVGSTYRTTWETFYAARTSLLNAISAKAKTIADSAVTTANAAQTTANNASTAATTAQTDATNALTQLTNITSDNVLSAAEKGEQRSQWNVISSEYAGIINQANLFSITTELNNYTAYFQALANYLNNGTFWSTGIPTWLADANLGTNTTIVGGTYRTNWKNYYDSRTTLLNAIAAKAKTLADAAQTQANTATTNAATAQTTASNAQTDATNALGQLTNITSDNVLSIAEKSDQRREWNIVSAEKSGLDTQATTFGITTEKTTYDTNFQTLATYLNNGTAWASGVPSWLADANLGTNTTIVGGTYRTNWENLYSARTALLNAIAGKAKTLADAAQTTANTANSTATTAQTTANNAQTDATNALGQLSNITSDNVLSVAEKSQQRSEWNVISAEYAGIINQSNLFGITTELNNYTGYFQVLANYLNNGTFWSTGIPAWLADANMGTNTTIVGATYRTNWKNYYDSRTTLLNAIAAKAKTLADAAQTQANTATTNAATAQSTANSAASAASAAQTDATNALNQLTNIASDNVLSAVEKSGQRADWNIIAAEKSSLNTQATTFSITTENTTYNNAFQALATYLNNGTTWSSGIPSWLADANLGTNTTIVGSTYRTNWETLYTARTALLNAIAAKAKALADNAQSTADNIQIGGRNLFRNGDYTNGLFNVGTIFGSGTIREVITDATFGYCLKTSSSIHLGQVVNIGVQAGVLMTISFYAKAVTPFTLTLAGIGFDSGTPTGIMASGTTFSITAAWKKFTYTFTTSNYQIDGENIYLYTSNNDANPMYITRVQLETGNKATDWTPAPEDQKSYSDSRTQTVIDGGLVTTGRLEVGATNLGSANAGINGSVSGSPSTDIRFWAGDTFANRATAPFRVQNNGTVVMTNATVTGTVNSSSGIIGGFTIGSYSLTSSDTSNEMYLSSSLLRFTNNNNTSYVYLGSDVMPASLGGYISTPMRIEVTRSAYGYYGNVGIYFNVTGTTAYDDDVNTGNHALFIANGDIAGFRLRTRRISATATLTDMDNVVLLVNSANITLNLPSTPKIGQMYIIRRCTNYTTTVSAGSNYISLKDASNKVGTYAMAGWQALILNWDEVNSIWWGWFSVGM